MSDVSCCECHSQWRQHFRCTILGKQNFYTLYILVYMSILINGISGQFTCNQPGHNEVIKWREQVSNLTVRWSLEEVCSGTIECYGFQPETGEVAQDVQLCPAQMQYGDSLYIIPPPPGSPYTTTVVNVTESEFYSCPSKIYPPNRILQNSDSSRWLRIPDRFLLSGVLYLAQHPDGFLGNCNYGLRIKILIKRMNCKASPAGSLCSGRGTCGSKLFEDGYRCYCYENYRGDYCNEYDACATGPCRNGANCVDGNEGLLGSNFLCVCTEGFTGADCSEILGQCSPSICGNGSCIAVSPIAFKCQCRQGHSGSYCQHFSDMCIPDPCYNQATCISQFQGYTCQCPPGYTGTHCETNIDECASGPCASGATCVDDVNGFYCRCPPGFDSGLCLEPIDFCQSNPCNNGADCLPVLNGFYCNCSLGFHGYRCQDVISQCSQAPGVCQNGGHCLQSPGGPIQCQCSPGWTGPTCHRLDNLCRFNPCPNATICIDTSTLIRPGTYECDCPPGYTGPSCQTEIQECASNPCRNGGVCIDLLASYTCRCPDGYNGTNCENNIDMCSGRSHLLCQNNGTCVDGDIGFSYSCVCLPGFTSADCSDNIQECESSPCLNNGTCLDGINSYSCLCRQHYLGPNCADYFDYCSYSPCGAGATCISKVGTYQCVCPPGISGRNCTEDQDECASNPCRSEATCLNLYNAFRCECPSGYTGRLCEENVNDCVPGACLNGATCIDQLNGYRCACVQGFAGEDCGREIIECLSAPCLNGGLCSDKINGYTCYCDETIWAGVNCQIPLNNCSYAPCKNGATCEPINNAEFRCKCPDRYTGSLCGTYMELCESQPCQNGASCSENLEDNQYDCICPFGYYGKFCENNQDFCENHKCTNGATCLDGTQGYTCKCPPGFRGLYCEIDKDNCASSPCRNGALCQDKVNGYQCFCVNGYVGTQCTEDINECISSPCLNGAQCLNGRDRFVCECAVGFTGVHCETNIDDCADNKCTNGATCVDDIGGFICRCSPGFVGADCSVEIDECLSSPCNPQGTFLCNDGIATYTCVCKAGYRGRLCELEIDECSSQPCLNGATCANLVNGFRCICPEGITGNRCEINIDICSSSPCGVGTCVESGDGYVCNCPSDGKVYDRNCIPVQPCLSRPCFNKGKCNNLPNDQYQCVCPLGYEGKNCEKLNMCVYNNITCRNGGICVMENGNFTCVCNAGYEGQFCQVNKDECVGNLCRNGATCVDGINKYSCQCVAGFVGRFCESRATACSQQPCRNGAECRQRPNFSEGTLFTCLCPSGYEGAYCQIETDACSSSPCRNGGTCRLTASYYTCDCKPGYTGTNCQVNIDECRDNVCKNGATCVDGIDGYSCQCPVGLSGFFCENEINDCISSPCRNGGRCLDLQDGFQCFCKNGFTGLTCAQDYDECMSSPCRNGATCLNRLAKFECQCIPGTTGILCEVDIDECRSSPCLNGAQCVDGLNSFSCTCRPGLTGSRCETDTDECTSNPCSNGGTCRDRENMYVCDCPQPYRGDNCALLPCDLNPCESGGTCYNDLSRLPDGFRCDCLEGLTGTRCQSNIDDCRRPGGAVPCSGKGLCLDRINGYFCHCEPGWKGKDCEVPIDECVDNKCRNNATCINQWLGYRCQCVPGFEGQLCERETDECAPFPCTNGATCVDLHNDYRCICNEGWTGKRCETEINECTQTLANPCRNGGTCVDMFANFTCQCPPFFTGRLCQIRYDPCDASYNQCVNGATCITNGDGTYSCRCALGFTGTNCEIDTDECSSNPCRNGAQCEDRPAGYVCYCLVGFIGLNCEADKDDCLYCRNGATCQDLVNGYICSCTEEWKGTNCTEDVNECVEYDPCKNGGTCTNMAGGYSCVCKQGYTGLHCEVDIDECQSRPCLNGASCQQNVGSFTCSCPRGYAGELCQANIDECLSNPCGTGNCIDLVNGYTCECQPGWTGSQCGFELNECLSQPCLNEGLCIDGINQYNCVCEKGFTGSRCEIDVDVCENREISQCQNGGTCMEAEGSSFFCLCKPGYAGRLCDRELDECLSQPCKNGGTCEDRINAYACTCLPGLVGVQCGIDINECESSPCVNEGLCEQRAPGAGYECLCRPGLGGPNCEINYDDCLPSPRCMNGGTCLDGVNNFTCACPPHATGAMCQTLLFNPTSTASPSTSPSTDPGSSLSTLFPSPGVSSTQLPADSTTSGLVPSGLVSDMYTSPPVVEASLLSGTDYVTQTVEDSSSPMYFVSVTSTLLLSTLNSFESLPSGVTPSLTMESELLDSSQIIDLGSSQSNLLATDVLITTTRIDDGMKTLNLNFSSTIDSLFTSSLYDGSDSMSMTTFLSEDPNLLTTKPLSIEPSIESSTVPNMEMTDTVLSSMTTVFTKTFETSGALSEFLNNTETSIALSTILSTESITEIVHTITPTSSKDFPDQISTATEYVQETEALTSEYIVDKSIFETLEDFNFVSATLVQNLPTSTEIFELDSSGDDKLLFSTDMSPTTIDLIPDISDIELIPSVIVLPTTIYPSMTSISSTPDLDLPLSTLGLVFDSTKLESSGIVPSDEQSSEILEVSPTFGTLRSSLSVSSFTSQIPSHSTNLFIDELTTSFPTESSVLGGTDEIIKTQSSLSPDQSISISSLVDQDVEISSKILTVSTEFESYPVTDPSPPSTYTYTPQHSISSTLDDSPSPTIDVASSMLSIEQTVSFPTESQFSEMSTVLDADEGSQGFMSTTDTALLATTSLFPSSSFMEAAPTGTHLATDLLDSGQSIEATDQLSSMSTDHLNIFVTYVSESFTAMTSGFTVDESDYSLISPLPPSETILYSSDEMFLTIEPSATFMASDTLALSSLTSDYGLRSDSLTTSLPEVPDITLSTVFGSDLLVSTSSSSEEIQTTEDPSLGMSTPSASLLPSVEPSSGFSDSSFPSMDASYSTGLYQSETSEGPYTTSDGIHFSSSDVTMIDQTEILATPTLNLPSMTVSLDSVRPTLSPSERESIYLTQTVSDPDNIESSLFDIDPTPSIIFTLSETDTLITNIESIKFTDILYDSSSAALASEQVFESSMSLATLSNIASTTEIDLVKSTAIFYDSSSISASEQIFQSSISSVTVSPFITPSLPSEIPSETIIETIASQSDIGSTGSIQEVTARIVLTSSTEDYSSSQLVTNLETISATNVYSSLDATSLEATNSQLESPYWGDMTTTLSSGLDTKSTLVTEDLLTSRHELNLDGLSTLPTPTLSFVTSVSYTGEMSTAFDEEPNETTLYGISSIDSVLNLLTTSSLDQDFQSSIAVSNDLKPDNVSSSWLVPDRTSLLTVSPTASTPPISSTFSSVVTDVSPSVLPPIQTTTATDNSPATTASPTTGPVPRNCFDAPCLNGGTCQTIFVGGQLSYMCQCTQAFTGRRCQIAVDSTPTEFVGSSILTFRPIPLQSINVFNISFQTLEENGVIFYSAKDYSSSDATHFIRLLVKDGLLRYQFSCVVQNFDLNSNVRVNTGQLFNVIVRQTIECKAKLEVSGPIPTKSVELGMPFVFPTLRLTSLSTLYVGGLPSNLRYVPTHAPNFVGCITFFYINNQEYGVADAIEKIDIGTCGQTLPTSPPITGSTTTQRTVTTTSASTTTDGTGQPPQTCDQIICLNGGTCRNLETPSGNVRYRCDCPLHYTGTHCEQEIGISFPEFLGNSYIKHPDLDFSERRSNDLFLSFKTKTQDGSLLYSHGPLSNDFIHLFIAQGYLRYQASCGPTNVLFVDTRVRVDGDSLVSVNVRQIQEEDGDCTVTVTINNDVETAVTLTLQPSQGSLQYDLGALYLGGLPPGVLPTGRASPFINYVGCIRHLQINGIERLVYQDALEGLNIRECDVPPCQYQPCYNNATCIPSLDGFTCECLPSYSGVLCERTACDRNPCFHGGTCIHTPHTQDYTCLCPYGRHGVNCQLELEITRPQYYGKQFGYISFIAYPQISALDLMFDFRFSFTLAEGSLDTSGLLIYAGQGTFQSQFGADYLAVGIIDNYLHFQFNLGSGKADIRTTSPIDRSRNLHRVRFGRNRQQGYLGIDEQLNVTGSSQGALMGLNIFSSLYVGGYDNFALSLPVEIPFRQGFTGCISDLEVRTGSNGQWKKPGSPAGQPERGRNVGQCDHSECQLSNCHNGGTCVDLGSSFRCECAAGWKGVICADRITPCDSQHACSHGSTCLPIASGGYTCQCPLGKSGELCDKEIQITDARFVGESSYMGFQHKGSLRFAVDIHLQFKPDVNTGLLVYMAEHMSLRSGDFLSVSLRDGNVQLRYRVGVEGTDVVTSSNTINIASGTWHALSVGRNTTHGYVELDGTLTFLSVKNQMVGLDVTTPIFIGGVPSLEVISSSALEKEPSAFEGCVRELIINKKRYELNEKGATSGVNVIDCDGDICGYGVCKNGGMCSNNASPTGYFCTCLQEYSGVNCELPRVCENNECQSGSTCIPFNTDTGYTCVCPIGKQGPRCSQELIFNSPRFTGSSYIQYIDRSHNESDFTQTFISLNFSTPVPNGLLLWNGQAYSDQDDYIGVGVHNSRVRVVVSLGWWTREDLITEEMVSDSNWHSIIIQRSGRQLAVYVDGKRYLVNLAGQFSGLNTDGTYYFGGFERGKDVLDETCGHFPAPFIGCMKDVYIRTDSQPILFSRATSGANIQSCDRR